MQKINITKPIDLSKFTYVNYNIKDIKHKIGERYLKLYQPNKDISSQDLLKDIEAMTETIDGITYKGRPATIEELASYEGDEDYIVALGEKFEKSVAFRRVNGSSRALGLPYLALDWDARFRFLVAFDISDTSDNINDAISLLKSEGYKITKQIIKEY